MNKQNKILCFVLSLCIVFTCILVPTASFADEAAVEENFLSNKSLLGKLGILKINIEDSKTAISRAQFVDIAVRTYVDDLSKVEEAKSFSDVIPNHEYKDALEAAYSTGIIKGNGNGIFGIDELITPKAAVTIMLRILGYEQILQWQGGFEENYISTASKIGLLNDVDISGESMTFENALQLVANAIEISPYDIEGIKNGSVSYGSDKEATLISERLEIYELDGIVTENEFTSLNGVSKLDDGYVKISGTLLKVGTTNAADYIGYTVRAYVKTFNGEAIPTVLHIEDDRSDVTLIDAKDFGGFSNGTLSYYKNGNSKKSINIDETALIVYNGALVKGSQYNKNLFDIDNGSITVIKKSLGGLTVVLIKQYNDMVFDRMVETEDYTAFIDKYNPENNIIIEDLEMLDIKDANGQKLSADQLVAGCVISAAISLDGKCGYLVVSSDVLNQAFVTAVGDDSVILKTYNEPIHTYDEGEYKYTTKFKEINDAEKIVNPTSEYTVYINYSGDISHMELETDMSDFYAYIIDYATDQSAFDSSLRLKVFKADGKTGIYDVADKVIIDGVKYNDKSATEIIGHLGLNSNTRSRLVYMSLTYDSEIREVDTCLDETNDREMDYTLYKEGREDENTLYKIDGKEARWTTTTPNRKYYASETKSFNTGIYIGSNTVIMAIPRDSKDEDRFKILTTASLVNGRYYMVDAYGRNDATLPADIVLFHYFSRYDPDQSVAETNGTTLFARTPFATTYDTDAAFVNRLSKGTDPNTGEEVDILYLTVLRTGAEAVHYIDDPSLTEGISQGDIVRWYTLGGAMCYLEKAYDVKDKEFNPNPRAMKWQSGSVVTPSYYLMHDNTFLSDSYASAASEVPIFGMARGVIVENNSSHLCYVTYNNYEKGNVGQKYWKICTSPSVKVYKYNEKDDSLEKARLDETISYSDSELVNSEAVIISKSSVAQAIILY